jgi:hypothetical protein
MVDLGIAPRIIQTGDMLSVKGSSGMGGEGMYQLGLEYCLSLEFACTWSSEERRPPGGGH